MTAATGNVTNYAGTENASTAQVGKISASSRGLATSLVIGSDFSVGLDQGANLYVSDTSSGVIWRVDAGSSQMYAIAGGAASVCSSATDAVGDGCPGPQTTFSNSGLKFATSNTPGPAGVRVDLFGNLLVTDSIGNLVRKISNGTQFGTINGSEPTQMLEVHYGVNDGPAASNPYALTAGASNFVLGPQNCTANSDNTMDCVLPVQATPSVPGLFSGTLVATSKNGLTGSFALGGRFFASGRTVED